MDKILTSFDLRRSMDDELLTIIFAYLDDANYRFPYDGMRSIRFIDDGLVGHA